MPGDDSCLFHSVAFALESNLYQENQKNVAASLRKLVSHHLLKDPHKTYTSIDLENKSVKEYIKFIENEDQWGGFTELKALSRHYNVQFFVFKVLSLALSPMKIPNTGKFKGRVYLILDARNENKHYDIVIASDKKTQEFNSIFDCDDSNAEEKCAGLALRLQQGKI
jgi:hypothetical protein